MFKFELLKIKKLLSYIIIKKNEKLYLNLFQSICKEAPFSDDPEAIAERDASDYNTQITLRMARSGKGWFTRVFILYSLFKKYNDDSYEK